MKIIPFPRTKKVNLMAMNEKLNLMKDLLEHMGDCCDEWPDEDGRMQRIFADSLRRDLTEFHRLCDSLLYDSRYSDSRMMERRDSPALAVC